MDVPLFKLTAGEEKQRAEAAENTLNSQIHLQLILALTHELQLAD